MGIDGRKQGRKSAYEWPKKCGRSGNLAHDESLADGLS
jgi:hypothetical protein